MCPPGGQEEGVVTSNGTFYELTNFVRNDTSEFFENQVGFVSGRMYIRDRNNTYRYYITVDENGVMSLKTSSSSGTSIPVTVTDDHINALIDTKLESAHPTELITIPASAWTGTEAPYFAMNQACSIATMTNTLSVSLSPTLTNPDDGMAEILSASTYNAIAEARIMAVVQADGGITFAAYGKKPEIDIPVIVTEVG